MATEDGVGSFLAGWLCQSVVCCHGQWKVTIRDKDGPSASCGRKVCWLPISITGWQPCVEMLPQVTKQLLMGYSADENGHDRFCCSMTMQDCKAVNKQHKKWHPLDTLSYHIHHILQIWPHWTIHCSTKWNNHSTGENSLPMMTCREVSATRCRVSPKDGALLLSKSYREMATVHRPQWGVCQKYYSRRLVTQMSVNHLRTTFVSYVRTQYVVIRTTFCVQWL
jgi:hypothetical protein